MQILNDLCPALLFTCISIGECQTDLIIDLTRLASVCQGAVERAGRADVVHLARVPGPSHRFGRGRRATLRLDR